MAQTYKFSLIWFTIALMALLGFCHGGTAYAASTPSVFFTSQQYQTFQTRNALLPNLGSCTVPNVTITHSPGYVSTTPTQTLYANLAATPHAVCNDGSPAAFLFRPGFGAAANRWVIYLVQGGECDTQASCIARQNKTPTDVSSLPYSSGEDTIYRLGGILSPNPNQNPDFYDANLVQIEYCSSDYWEGEKTGNTAMTPAQIAASHNVANWYFDGHGVVQGVIQLLQKSYGLNNATDVLLAGGSAGAVGVYMNANYVSGLLASATRFAAVADSGYSLSTYKDYDAATGGQSPPPTNFEAGVVQGQSIWSAVGDFSCAAASLQAGGKANKADCFATDYLAQNGFYHIPFFIKASYYDTVLLQTYNLTNPVTAPEQTYIYNFGAAMNQSLTSTDNWISLFGPADDTHTLIINNPFTKVYDFPNNVMASLAEAVGYWYRAPCSAPRLLQPPLSD